MTVLKTFGDICCTALTYVCSVETPFKQSTCDTKYWLSPWGLIKLSDTENVQASPHVMHTGGGSILKLPCAQDRKGLEDSNITCPSYLTTHEIRGRLLMSMSQS